MIVSLLSSLIPLILTAIEGGQLTTLLLSPIITLTTTTTTTTKLVLFQATSLARDDSLRSTATSTSPTTDNPMRSKGISLKRISTTVNTSGDVNREVKRLEALVYKYPDMYSDIIGTLHHDYPGTYNNIINTLRYKYREICNDSNSMMIEESDTAHKTETEARRITVVEQSLASSRISDDANNTGDGVL